MRHFTFILAAFGFLMIGCAATAGGGGEAPDAPVKVVPMPSGLGDDYVEMQRDLTFTPEQKAKFDEALKARNAGYDAWAKSPRGMRYSAARNEEAAARRANDADKLAKLTPEVAELRKEQEKVRTDLRREFNKVLTLEQQKQWAGRNLYIRALAALKNPTLTDAQKKQAREIANGIAAGKVKQGTAEKDPYLLLDEAAVNQTTEEIKAKVLPSAK